MRWGKGKGKYKQTNIVVARITCGKCTSMKKMDAEKNAKKGEKKTEKAFALLLATCGATNQ